jgi:hypothetical protein
MTHHDSKIHSLSAKISPAAKASNQVLVEHEQRTSVESQRSDHVDGHNMPAVEAERLATAPAQRWTTANRIG